LSNKLQNPLKKYIKKYRMKKNIFQVIGFSGIQRLHKKHKSFTLLLVLFTFLVAFQSTSAQTISGTGTSNAVCGDCVPTGWINGNGTPDISDRNIAGGGTTQGSGSAWLNAPLPLPPSGDVRWITLRDIGTLSGGNEERVSTNMTGLVNNNLYKLKLSSMTSVSDASGVGGVVYGGVFMNAYDIQIAGNPRIEIPLTVNHQDVWGSTTIVFYASNVSGGTLTLNIYPRTDSPFNGSDPNLVEMVHISINSLDALELLDSDGDGIDDATDIDDDNDGILDTVESGGSNPNGDSDGDGIPNYLDTNGGALTDVNNDGIPDSYDFDLDGISNHLDLDSDGDGILDNVEGQTTAGYIVQSGSVGVNGLYDLYEDTNDSGTPNFTPTNTDGNSNDSPDYLDIDSDDDGIPDNVEAQSTSGYITPTGNVGKNGVDSVYENVDTYSPATITLINTDLDALPDFRDTDTDADGTPDIQENGDTDNVISGTDTDGDGLDDNFDNDNVNYDVNDNINTPASDLPNADSGVDAEVDYRDDVTGVDTDGDGIPDSIDIDDDNDGILDTVECPVLGPIPAGNAQGIFSENSVANSSRAIGSNNSRANINHVNDYLVLDLGYNIPSGTIITVEARVSNNPHQMSVEQSIDGTNFSNLQTYAFTVVGGGDQIHNYTLTSTTRYVRLKMSTDAGSGAVQIDNVAYQSFSLGSTCLDTDGDGISDSLDLDSDNDGIIDNIEAQTTAGYVAPSGSVGANGLYDIYEDTNDSGISNLPLTNTDGDTYPDYIDIDSDNDGIPDNVEAQTTAGYAAPNNSVGVNGLDSAYDFTDNYNASGVSVVDTDGDNIKDYRDADSDNDGTPDIQENGEANVASGNDTDKDGLDDAFDDVSSPFDPNDNINVPTYDLPDTDFDASTSGDVDYRDTVNGVDTDGDGIIDSVDIDDDNDGILDTAECFSTVVSSASAASVKSENSLGGGGGIAAIGSDNLTANLNNLSDELVLDLGLVVVAGTIIEIEASVGNVSNEMKVQESGNNVVYINPQVFTNMTTSDVNYTYTLSGDTRFIKITMNVRVTSNLKIDNVLYQAFNNPCGGDTDGDGIPDALDLDSDNDGILDVVEAQTTTAYIAPTGSVGANGYYDVFETGVDNGIPKFTPVMTVNDGKADYLDIDSDDDGIPDNVEAQSTQGYVVPNGVYGINGVDTAYKSNDTFTATALSPPNSGGTTQPDFRDIDSDGDAILDSVESGITPNGGSGDTDGDGLLDIYEGGNLNDADVNDEINNPLTNLADGDGDANSTGDLDYRDASSDLDKDADGVLDVTDLDDDNDGIIDSVEDANTDLDNDPLTNPTDTDGDGIPNHLDIDSDGDGIPDNIEAQTSSGYTTPSGIGTGITDIDNDGLDDNYDANTAGTANSNGITNLTNTDGDATPDYLDTDSDADGTLDIAENGDADIVASGTDTDNDGLDDNFEGGNLNDSDVNDEINNPLVNLPDTDGDSGGAGDVDFRDDTDDSVPVGVAGNVLWLRADKNVTGTATVTGWGDQTTPAFNATASNPPSKIDDGLNFNPTIRFDGNNDFMQITNGVLGNAAYTDVWVYAVSMSTSATTATYTVSQGTAAETLYLQAPTSGSNLAFQFGNATELSTAWGGIAGEFSLWNAGSSTTAGSTPSTANKAIYRNGLQLTTNNSGDNITSTNQNLYLGSVNGSGSFMNGDIAEVMVFTNVPSSARQQQIQSYLAMKYGITLDETDNDGTIVEGDYILEDLSTKIWDRAANSTYHNDIAAIGRDDAMALIQKQSKSINSDATITIGLGSIASNNITNTANLNSNKSFLAWGNNGAALTNSSTKTLLCAPEVQLDRKWKIVETGSVGTVQIAITQANVNGFVIDNVLNTANTIKVLKVADDANFTTNVKHIPVISTSINGVNHYVANFDFNGTKYFTYSEINGIFWNGNNNSWTGGAGTNFAPSNLAADIDKVLVIDAESSLTNITLAENVVVECVWVKVDSKLMVADDRFLEFDENFVLEGEIRLIGDAQLVQTHVGLSNVQGNGKLYRDQKSVLPNIYRYNYWSSPVVAALGNTTYTVANVMKDGTGPTSENSATKDITFIPRSTSLDGSTTDPITIAKYWIFSYFNGTTGADWVSKKETGAINVAEGYTMKSTGRTPQNYTFVGSPNDGDFSKTVAAGTTSLIGNPYPSVIDATLFITQNDAVLDGTLYFWEHKGEAATSTVTEGHNLAGYIGGYSQRNQAMGVAANSIVDGISGLGNETYTAPTQYVAVGQGFFVSAPANKGGTFSFKNSQRLFSANNLFFKGQETNTELPNFKLGMDYKNNANIDIHRQLGINFKEGNTFNYESGFDSQTFDLQATDIYWNFPEINSNLIIAGIGKIDSQLQVPLGIKIDTDDPVTLMVDDKVAMDGYNIYLVDLLTGQIKNFNNPIELNLSKGTYTDRFIIIFGGTALGLDDVDIQTGSLFIFTDNSSNEIVIKNSVNTVVKNVKLYTVIGQKVSTWKNFSPASNYRLKTGSLPAGVYIVKVDSDKGQFSKKILITN